MATQRSLGQQFGWLWAAFAVSTFGTWVAFDALAVIAILVLHAGPTEVSIMTAAGLAVGALVAVPLGPWVEFRRKRPVMIAMDLIRFAALASIPAAFVLGRLSFAQLLAVSMIVGAANIVFRAASGAFLKALVPAPDLLLANGRFESTTWTATALGPPLGGAAIGLLGPVTTVIADALSYLCSAAAIAAIGIREPRPMQNGATTLRADDLLAGWRYILGHPTLRPLFFNTILVGGLIMATMPLIAVLMLGDLGFKPWQYGLAFGLPCNGASSGGEWPTDSLSGLDGAGSCLSPALCARAGRSDWPSSAPATAALCSSSPSNLDWFCAWAYSTRCWQLTGSSKPQRIAWPARWRHGRLPAASPSQA
jgi:MFS family permease